MNNICMDAWLQIVEECSIQKTPLDCYFYKEYYNNLSMALDTTKLRKTGFQWTFPHYCGETAKQFADEFIKQGLWPTATGPLPFASSSENEG
jgi:hypothetical protein